MVGKAGCVIRNINTLFKRKATGLRVLRGKEKE
ncbi:hypothetical protein QFZ73_004202 [Peribacillus sp. V2I11]|nr:hypothetical protein [Peribacillus sp. V2I11]